MTVESFYCNTSKHQKNTEVHTDVFLPHSNQPHLDSTLARAALVKLPLVCRAKRVRSQAVFQTKNLFRVVNVFFLFFFFITPLFLYMIHDTIQQSMDFFSGLWDFDPGTPYCMQYVILVFYIILHCG